MFTSESLTVVVEALLWGAADQLRSSSTSLHQLLNTVHSQLIRIQCMLKGNIYDDLHEPMPEMNEIEDMFTDFKRVYNLTNPTESWDAGMDRTMRSFVRC